MASYLLSDIGSLQEKGQLKYVFILREVEDGKTFGPNISIKLKVKANGGAGEVICKFRISGHIAETVTFTFSEGFQYKPGDVSYFRDPIDIPVNQGALIIKYL